MRNVITATGVFPAKEQGERHDVRLGPTSTSAHSRRRAAEASNFTIAVVMAGIFAFFIAGIASAFIYAKDTTVAQVASEPAAVKTPAETTGSAAK